MTTKKSAANPSAPFEAAQPIMEWWTKQWMQGATPMTRMQLAWMENLSEIMQQEARFLSALAEASQRIAKCYDTNQGDPMKMNECYQELAKEVAEHHMERMKNVANLSHDFRARIWEEI
ncbi:MULTISPECIES: hypothetical protein [Halomonas]|uniref:Phasin protein n=1 Tax=Halomonas chromatireducens TaxID=507626 RepID=A0A120JWQ9_9GAMM|nr:MULTISPECIES: hypothetical protein [Halomonas]AMD02366.1 hypothetical protein LOKO_03321 [Halomonas chromatireducens]MBZ0330286.1 hypothetical protein [Halomonas sp. ANAO-440]